MDLMVFLNGSFVKAGDAKISVYDHGFLYGDGAFETMRVYQKHVFRFEDHIQRLHNSLQQIFMELPASPNVILKTIKLLLQYNQLSDAYVRVMVTRGEGPIGLDISQCPQPTLFVVVESSRNPPDKWYVKGIPVVIVPRRKLPDVCMPSSIKSCNYLVNILAKKDAQDKGAVEGIMLNIEGYIAEGTISNIFIVKDKKIFTPALSSGILDGITRRAAIELAEARRIEVIESHISPDAIFQAEECFLTNTSMEIMPVTMCDGQAISDGNPGKMTRLLLKDYRKLVEENAARER